MPKQKLLILIDWFTPGYKAGGPIRSTLNIAVSLKEQYEIFVLTTDTDHGEIKPLEGIKANEWTGIFDSAIKVYYANKQLLKPKHLLEQIKAVNPDFIYLNHMWSPLFVLYPLWLKYTGKISAKVILCPRGGMYESALKVKKYKKSPVLMLLNLIKIQNHITFHATNEREENAIKEFFPGSKRIIAYNLPASSQLPFNSLHKEIGVVKCIFIARIVAIKNLLFLIKSLQQVTINVLLTIVGPNEDKDYWLTCQELIKKLPANVSVEYIGPKDNAALSEIMQKHHLFVLPTVGENFGHSIFEAFLSGRPVLISDQTPWSNLEKKQIGWDLPLDNQAEFSKKIQQVGLWNQEEFNTFSMNAWHFAKNYIENPEVKKGYLKLFSLN